MSGIIIFPDESFLVSTPIKVKGIESENHAFLCMLYSLCRSHVIDDTRLYAYFIGTCIFYRVILGTPLLCSQCVAEPEEMGGFLCGSCNISKRKNGKIKISFDSRNHFSVTQKSLIITRESAGEESDVTHTYLHC